MAAGDIVPVPGESFEQALATSGPDMLREMIRAFAQKMTGAEVEAACGAGYGEVSPNREAIIRLAGAVLAEQDDEWTEGRRYMGPEILAACRKAARTRSRPRRKGRPRPGRRR